MSSVPVDNVLDTSAEGSSRRPRLPVVSAILGSRVAWMTMLTVFLIVWGWLNRDNSYITAEEGTGYWLGILGGSAMLLLLLYPLRKKARFMRNWGPVGYWFGAHMFLGVAGPLMILYHANFSTGSLNSNIALFSMLLVAGSGVIGRFLYGRIHMGMSGHKATMAQLREEMQISRGRLNGRFTLSKKILKKIRKYEKRMLRPHIPVLGLFSLGYHGFCSLSTYLSITHQLHRSLRQQARKHDWDRRMRKALLRESSQAMREYIRAVRRAGEFQIYERFFALWNLLHLPLFLLLMITGTVHVIAVHMY